MAPLESYAPRVALVTGAGQGIGRAIALRLASEGIDLALNDIPRNAEVLDELAKELREKGRRVVPLIADVSVEEDVKAMVEKTVEELGELNVMIANAGIAHVAPVVETTVEAWERVFAVNVRGTMLCYKYAAAQMIKQGHGGRIIGASSVMGKKGCPMVSAYCSSKFAVRGLTQSLACELAQHNITVNAYAPGVILTAMTNNPRDLDKGEGKHGDSTKSLLGLPPSAPDAEPEVIASIVSYLVKPETYFITGQAISVDGGVYMS
ncbi:NAD(P)-binding protein [Obba rivulosa]|uniref:NAD(P)-binding protein n=1 Tax=Obba rivulosa TaxID=1052685 RepID=A0A8E2DL84_9APHY|nr:NAD(P)-binding protein [Obba rivulosa]